MKNKQTRKHMTIAEKAILSLLMGWFSFFIACGIEPLDDPDNKPIISVSILPQKYFVQRIVGDNFFINVVIPPGHDPHTYAPTPHQMRTLSRSILYFQNGNIPIETNWVKRVAESEPSITLVDTSKGIELIPGTNEEDGKKHDHSGFDPHTWLSPKNVKIIVQKIYQAVMKMEKNPANRQTYEKNYLRFISDIDTLDREFSSLLAPYKNRKFMVFHPAWGYFARDYHVQQLPIEVEGKSPSMADFREAIDIAKKENIHIIFIQKQTDTHVARAVADEINGQVVVLDPLSEDWFKNMKQIAVTLSQTLKLAEPHGR